MAIEAWKVVMECLKDYASDLSPQNSCILRDLAIAKIKLDLPGGLELLDKAIALDPNDADALCALGDALLPNDRAEANARHEDAYRLKPAYGGQT